jgi:hypothetical protein
MKNAGDLLQARKQQLRRERLERLALAIGRAEAERTARAERLRKPKAAARGAALRPQPTRKPRVKSQSLLDRYLRRKQIGQRQYEAGCLFAHDWEIAKASGARIGSYAPLIASGTQSWHLESLAGSALGWAAAARAIGAQLVSVVIHVCVLDQSTEAWAQARGKPERDGMPVLRLALDALAEHYARRGAVLLSASKKGIELRRG